MIQDRCAYDLVVKGDVVMPYEILYDAAVAIKDGKIKRILRGNESLSASKTIDAGGCYILRTFIATVPRRRDLRRPAARQRPAE
ncbi:MAG: hypothetical protein AB2404_12580 [Planifilum fimeticola]